MSCRLSSFHNAPETPTANKWLLPMTALEGKESRVFCVCVSMVLLLCVSVWFSYCVCQYGSPTLCQYAFVSMALLVSVSMVLLLCASVWFSYCVWQNGSPTGVCQYGSPTVCVSMVLLLCVSAWISYCVCQYGSPTGVCQYGSSTVCVSMVLLLCVCQLCACVCACVCVYVCVVIVHWHCSAQLSMFSMEKRSRNKIIIIIIVWFSYCVRQYDSSTGVCQYGSPTVSVSMALLCASVWFSYRCVLMWFSYCVCQCGCPTGACQYGSPTACVSMVFLRTKIKAKGGWDNGTCLTAVRNVFRPPRWPRSNTIASSERDPGTAPKLSQSYDVKIGTLVATLPDFWLDQVSARTGVPGVSKLSLGEIASSIFSLCHGVTTWKAIRADSSLRHAPSVAWT